LKTPVKKSFSKNSPDGNLIRRGGSITPKRLRTRTPRKKPDDVSDKLLVNGDREKEAKLSFDKLKAEKTSISELENGKVDVPEEHTISVKRGRGRPARAAATNIKETELETKEKAKKRKISSKDGDDCQESLSDDGDNVRTRKQRNLRSSLAASTLGTGTN